MRKNALDESQPILHRASLARSCAMLIAQKFKVERDVVIDRVRELSGIDLHNMTSGADIAAVIALMEDLRFRDGERLRYLPQSSGRADPGLAEVLPTARVDDLSPKKTWR